MIWNIVALLAGVVIGYVWALFEVWSDKKIDTDGEV